MKHKVYLRDWYFNAGIIGFLTIVADGNNLSSIPSLIIGKNYIEFDNEVFDDFGKKFTKHGFLKFFNHQAYLQRLQKVQKDLIDKKTKVKMERITKKIAEIEKSPYKYFLKLLNLPISKSRSIEDFVVKLENAKNSIRAMSKIQLFDTLNSSTKGRASLNNFVQLKLKGICSYGNIAKYIKTIKSQKKKKEVKHNDLCPSCQERKAEYEFNNAVSNIIGFNKDNSNWIWGFKASKLKICPLCALIYNCAFASFAYVVKNVDGNYLNYFYFPNENSNVKNLFETVKRFSLMLDRIEDNSNLLYTMIKQTVEHITQKQATSIIENINFIEIAENPITAGQGTKGYNIYNYNISLEIAEFLNLQFRDDGIPRGFYVIKNTYYSIEEELLRLAIARKINYSVLHRYSTYSLAPERYLAKYNLKKVSDFIIKYIQCIRGGSMEKSQWIVKKGFKNGRDLCEKLYELKKENQINGLVYSFLNDLKIADRYKFFDKYTRVMMANNLPLAFGQDEMLDVDYFLQFGYAFINGLMSKSKETIVDTMDNIKKEE